MEHPCGYAQSDLVVPLVTEATIWVCRSAWPRPMRPPRGGVARVNAAVHSEIAAVPDERLAVERDVLGRLPSLRCEIGAASVRRRLTGSPVCAMGPRATRCPPG